MELSSVKDVDRGLEPRCAVCGAPVSTGTLCRICREEGITPQRYAEMFWDEA